MKLFKIGAVVCSVLGMSLSALSQQTDNSRLYSRSHGTETVVKGDTLNSTNQLSIHRDAQKANSKIKRPEVITQLETFINNAIAKGAMPGCQILALKDGVIVYEKSFGTLNYDQKDKVNNNTLYDIASITKILSTTLAVMKLHEEGRILIHGDLMAYVPEVKGTNKAMLKLSDLMTHQAGLKSWIPFYKYTLDSLSGRPHKKYYSKDSTDNYYIPVAKNLFANDVLLDTVWKRINSSPLENRGRYVYSDLDLLYLEKVVQNVTGMPLDMYMDRFFYKPMQLKNITYNPFHKGWVARCAPTENDKAFRGQLVRGYVHDQAAAMLGGVAGHAGLFSNAYDVAAIMQMLLNGGVYNGKRYFKKETVELFTGYRSSISRRGYGFDKPEKSKKSSHVANACSLKTFGHQGFTGTCTWADPDTGIVFVLLANRVYPSAENSLFNKLSVRTEAQDLVYKILGY